ENWPRPVPFAALRGAARACLGPAPHAADVASDTRTLGLNLLHLYTANLVELHAGSPAFVREVSARPVASPLARLQAAAGASATNLRHERVPLDEPDRPVLRHLDGSRDRAALLGLLAGLNGALGGDRADTLERSLLGLARQALLVG